MTVQCVLLQEGPGIYGTSCSSEHISWMDLIFLALNTDYTWSSCSNPYRFDFFEDMYATLHGDLTG